MSNVGSVKISGNAVRRIAQFAGQCVEFRLLHLAHDGNAADTEAHPALVINDNGGRNVETLEEVAVVEGETGQLGSLHVCGILLKSRCVLPA